MLLRWCGGVEVPLAGGGRCSWCAREAGLADLVGCFQHDCGGDYPDDGCVVGESVLPAFTEPGVLGPVSGCCWRAPLASTGSGVDSGDVLEPDVGAVVREFLELLGGDEGFSWLGDALLAATHGLLLSADGAARGDLSSFDLDDAESGVCRELFGGGAVVAS